MMKRALRCNDRSTRLGDLIDSEATKEPLNKSATAMLWKTKLSPILG
jgi:hypothetical protein